MARSPKIGFKLNFLQVQYELFFASPFNKTPNIQDK